MAGIFSDEGISGTGTKKRAGFQRMIQACLEGKVDRVITKSISRFARNTADCLKYARDLKDRGISVFFEKEQIDTMTASGELLFTILSSLAQEESRNISENTQWGIRSRFRQGKPQINTARFFGYDKNAEGKLIINAAQAKIVRRIFREFLEGWTLTEISRHLIRERIPGVTGRPVWPVITLRRMLRNEKYKGDLLMQKYYTVNYLTREQAINDGKLDQYYVRLAHQPIVPEKIWEAAQEELARRQNFSAIHGIKENSYAPDTAFVSRVFCGRCGGRLLKKRRQKGGELFWRCCHTMTTDGNCQSGLVRESDLREAFTAAWMDITEHRREAVRQWDNQIDNGTALEQIRAKQTKKLTE